MLPLVPHRAIASQKRRPPLARVAVAFRHENMPVGVHLKRRKLQSVRLGGQKPRKVFILRRLIRRIKLKWLKSQYLRLIKKIKEYYSGLIKDMIEAGATSEASNQRVVMETRFAAINFSSIHHPLIGLDRRPYVV